MANKTGVADKDKKTKTKKQRIIISILLIFYLIIKIIT